jgi:hypothetical protein
MSVVPNVISAPMSCVSLVAVDLNIALPDPRLLAADAGDTASAALAEDQPGLPDQQPATARDDPGVCLQEFAFLGERAATPQQLNRFGN